MNISDLKEFALTKNIKLREQKEIARIAGENIAKRFSYNKEQIKENFDSLLEETEKEAYKVYLGFQQSYGKDVFNAFAKQLIEADEITDINQLGDVLGNYFTVFDKFYMSLAQSRRTRAGHSFEDIHNALFPDLGHLVFQNS